MKKIIILFAFSLLFFLHNKNVQAVDQEFKETLVVQDVTINDNNFADGNHDFLFVGMDKGIESCILLQFKDDVLTDPAVIIDRADFLFEIVDLGGNNQMPTTKQLKITPVEEAWDEQSVFWSNKPSYSFSNSLALNTTIKTEIGWTAINLKNIVQAWIDGGLKNNGIVICGNPQDNSLLTFRSSESGFPKLSMDYHYQNVALGNPVDDGLGLAGNVVEVNMVDNIDNVVIDGIDQANNSGQIDVVVSQKGVAVNNQNSVNQSANNSKNYSVNTSNSTSANNNQPTENTNLKNANSIQKNNQIQESDQKNNQEEIIQKTKSGIDNTVLIAMIVFLTILLIAVGIMSYVIYSNKNKDNQKSEDKSDGKKENNKNNDDEKKNSEKKMSEKKVKENILITNNKDISKKPKTGFKK
jgi:Na+-transporting methylmalonyl-CoA/oxaloacetate decarboxylase gamma subunit